MLEEVSSRLEDVVSYALKILDDVLVRGVVDSPAQGGEALGGFL